MRVRLKGMSLHSVYLKTIPLVTLCVILILGMPSTASTSLNLDGTSAPVSMTPISEITTNRNWITQSKSFDGVEMMLVPPGCFKMGSSNAEIALLSKQYPDLSSVFTNQGPQTLICFATGFWIDKYLVTNGQFARFNGKANHPSYWTGNKRPRETISWFEAQKFCTQRESRLPSEAEWEYAARGPDSLAFPWGNVWVPDNAIWTVWKGLEYPQDQSRQTADVGSKPTGASWIGALDMAGNVWEWTNSVYKPYPYHKDDGRENKDDTNAARVIRGGSWALDEFYLLSSYRIFNDPNAVENQMGFRCVRPINYD